MVQMTEKNSLDLQLDQEWVLLIKLAKNQGLSIDYVRNFLKEKNREVNIGQN
ncbi:anti-repressor SinI family protein [Lederbergia citri]|nr:anti-repressor SinI family protein [Lederbergia citri]